MGYFCKEVDLESHTVSQEFSLSENTGDQLNPFLFTSETYTVLAVWEDYRIGTNEYSDIYFQEISDGDTEFTAGGLVVSDGFHNQVNPKIGLLSDESEISYLLYWDDMRSSGKEDLINVFAQKLIIPDCTGTIGGEAIYDECGICDGDGPAENFDCNGNCIIDLDCAGVCGGSAINDECGVCAGDNSTCTGCMDNTACNYDLNATIGDDSCTFPDSENVDCNGNCIVEIDCNGVCGGSASTDICGVCNGGVEDLEDCTECEEGIDLDCAGVCGGSAIIDECGVCTGDNSTCTGCMDNTACNYDSNATIGDDSCIFPESEDVDCNGNCIAVIDCNGECGGGAINDECGVCGGDNSSCSGCTNSSACNYDLNATIEDDSCIFPESEDVDCNGNCIAVIDCNGECGGGAINDECGVCAGDNSSCSGCTDDTACNYDADAKINSGCEYAEENYDCDGQPLSIIEKIPTEYSLLQNYPNPFNPSTVIQFTIPEYSNVLLNIYNINGQLINSLVNENMNPGYHQVFWYGKDLYGNSVSNGIYIYVLETNKYRELRKMLFIK